MVARKAESSSHKPGKRRTRTRRVKFEALQSPQNPLAEIEKTSLQLMNTNRIANWLTLGNILPFLHLYPIRVQEVRSNLLVVGGFYSFHTVIQILESSPTFKLPVVEIDASEGELVSDALYELFCQSLLNPPNGARDRRQLYSELSSLMRCLENEHNIHIDEIYDTEQLKISLGLSGRGLNGSGHRKSRLDRLMRGDT